MNELTEMEYSQEYSSGPVTALAVVLHKIIAGCGNQMLIYDLNTLQLEARKEILEAASVHGICAGPTCKKGTQLLCVHGAKETRVVTLKKDEIGSCGFETQTQVFRAKDWIWTARWLKGETKGECVALALAHNSVALWDWQCGMIAFYSAHFIGESWDSLVLAAGTVFNQVVLWAVRDIGDASHKLMDKIDLPVLCSLSGHKGVIFSVRYDPDQRKLCSVSDDRTIQLWQLRFPDTSEPTPTVEDWKAVKSELLLTLFGHTARVWDAVLMNNCFASIGEDATCIVWNYKGKLMTKFKGHKGRSIWSIAATEDENCLITGGGDGSVRMWEIQAESSWSSNQRAVDIPQHLSLVGADFPRVITLLAFDVALVMMNSGCFSSYNLTDSTWHVLFKDDRFVSYSVVSPCPDARKVAVGSITGVIKILVIQDDKHYEVPQTEQAVFNGKVMGIAWITEEMLLVSGPDGHCLIIMIKTKTDGEDPSRISVEIVSNARLFLAPSKHRWITASCFVQLPSKLMLVCGDKDGSIHCYLSCHSDFTSPLSQDSLELQPSQTFHRVHGKTGVTSVHCKDGLVYSTGRDGCYRKWEAKGDNLILNHSVKVTKGFDWIDRLEWRDGDMLMYGFLSSYFVVWSVLCNQQLVSIHCGGGHRSWGCCHDNSALRFIYLKAGKISVVDSEQHNKQSIIKHPLHGRELCDVKFVKMFETKDDQPAFLIGTASHDTTVNVGLLFATKGFTEWKPLLNLKGHLSSVRCLAFSQCDVVQSAQFDGQQAKAMDLSRSKGDARHFILFTGGGRAEIRVWKLCLSDETQTAQERVTAGEVSITSSDLDSCETGPTIHGADGETGPTIHGADGETGPTIHGADGETGPTIHGADSALFNDSNHDLKLSAGGEKLASCTYEDLSTHFLGESRHKRRFTNWKVRKLRLDPETRVMSLAATALRSLASCLTCFGVDTDDKIQSCLKELHIVSAAGSDGVLRVFSYDSSSKQLLCRAQTSIHKGCVLKVMHFLNCPIDGKPDFYLFSTSTNGQILVWSLLGIVQAMIKRQPVRRSSKTTKDKERDSSSLAEKPDNLKASNVETCDPSSDSIDESSTDEEEYTDFTSLAQNPESEAREWKPLGQLKSHQSGVNSVSVSPLKDNIILVASGGDDNALTIQMIEVKDAAISVMSKVTKANAHAAQITGVWLVNPSLVVTVSIDQRICVWSLEEEAPSMKLLFLKGKYIHVADVSSMDFYIYRDSLYLLLGGEGICLYSLKESSGQKGPQS